ncbi:MAG: ABC transporter substrate-binding protein [Nanoarchaeota archaeon]
MNLKITALLGLILLLSACQSTQKIKIGILTPQTGDLAFLGTNIVRSAELAIQELGVQDQVELVIEDAGTVGGGKDAVTAYRKLVDLDKVQFIIDGMASDGTMAVAPFLDQDKVVMITPLTGGENVDNAAEFLFRNGPSDILAGTKPASDLTKKFAFTKIVLFTDNAEYTLDISKHFRAAYKGQIVSDEVILPDKTDYRTELLKMQGKGAQAIVINTASGNSAMYLMKQLYEMGNKLPILANFIAFNANTITGAGKGVEGVYIYDPEFDETSPLTQAFFVKYTKKYGTAPTIPFHTTGTYDAIKMGLEAINVVGYDGQKIHDYLLSHIQNWQGMNGLVSFNDKGNTETGFTLKQIKNSSLIKPI